MRPTFQLLSDELVERVIGEARHLLRLLFRRDTLCWTLRALFARRTGPG